MKALSSPCSTASRMNPSVDRTERATRKYFLRNQHKTTVSQLCKYYKASWTRVHLVFGPPGETECTRTRHRPVKKGLPSSARCLYFGTRTESEEKTENLAYLEKELQDSSFEGMSMYLQSCRDEINASIRYCHLAFSTSRSVGVRTA